MASNDPEINQLISSILLAGDGAVIGLGLGVIAIRTWLKFNFNSKALTQIQDRPVSQIADLRSLLSDKDNAHGNRNHDHDILPEPGPLVIVRGMVLPTAAVDGKESNQSESVIIAPDSGEEAVIFQKTQTCLYNEWRGLFGWSSPLRALLGGSMKEQVTTSVRKVPFVLIESDGLANLSHVHINLDNSRHLLPLTIAYQNLKPVSSPYTIFQAIFGRGYPVGLLDEEKILPPGQDITGIGRLDLTRNGHPVISSCKSLPCFLSKLTKDQLVEEIAIEKTFLFWSGMFLSTAAIGVLCYAAFRNWHKWKEWRNQRRAWRPIEEPNTSNAVDDESGDVPDGQLCVICLMRRRRSAFIPCGHHVCCSTCAHAVERDSNPKCPVCRQDVSNSVRIYDT